MADKPSGSTPPKRKPSFRRGVVIDVTQGTIRVRRWPRPRGKAKTKADQKRQDDFRIAQRASRYFAPQIMADIERATAGTPLLPRDLTTMMLFNRMYAFILPNGKVLYPMPAKRDVSESLDTITQTIGHTLVRGPNGWEGVPQGGGGGGGLWTVRDEFHITSPTSEIVFSDLGQYRDLMIYLSRVTSSSSDARYVHLGHGNPVQWLDQSGDYLSPDASGAGANSSFLAATSGGSTAARYLIATAYDAGRDDALTTFDQIARSRAGFIAATTAKITAVRVNAGNAHMTSGVVTLWTR